MPSRIRLLLVEDSDDDAQLIALTLRRDGLAVDLVRARSFDEVRAALAAPSERPDVVVADWVVPGTSALDVIGLVATTDPDMPIILVSGALREEDAVAALSSGARDFVVKERLRRLAPAIRREILAAERRREERAMRSRAAVVERLACVGVLARGLVHDINGMLSVVTNNLDYVTDTDAEGDETLDAVRDARAATARVADTVDSLRAFTTLGESVTTLDARALLESAARLVKVGSAADIVIASATTLPKIHASEAVVVQLFYSLLLAALGGRSELHKHVPVHLDMDGDYFRLSIGPVENEGLDEADARERDVRETVCRHLVESSSGKMSKTLEDAGTTWTVCLPAAPDPRSLSAPPAAPPSTDLKSLRVLVVDDDAMVRRTMGRLLHPAKVRLVSSATEGLDAISREGPYDAVLCDLLMDPVDGAGFVDLLRTVSPKHLPHVAFVTGFADREWVERRFPSVRVLYKPFGAADVRSLVASLSAGERPS